jgi:short-subunit dehydrogenase
MKNILIVGASKGLGNSMVEGLAEKNDTLYLVSRTKPLNLMIKKNYTKIWIKADMSNPECVNKILETVLEKPIDVFIYNAGIWETTKFEEVPETEVINIINVNLTSAILLTKKILKNLRKGKSKKIIFIGSGCGLENDGSDSIIYSATKFGTRGITHSLREYLRQDMISVSCINPGSIASDIPINKGLDFALKKYSKERIPVADIIGIIKFIVNSSIATCIKEVNVPALKDTSF